MVLVFFDFLKSLAIEKTSLILIPFLIATFKVVPSGYRLITQLTTVRYSIAVASQALQLETKRDSKVVMQTGNSTTALKSKLEDNIGVSIKNLSFGRDYIIPKPYPQTSMPNSMR